MKRLVKLIRPNDKIVYSPLIDQNNERQANRAAHLQKRMAKTSRRPEVNMAKRDRTR